MAPRVPSYLRTFDSLVMPQVDMSRTNARRAILLTALMMFVPIAQADLSEWRGPDAVKPSDGGSDFTALRIPTNATVLDSWMEISNEEVAQSSENLLSWHQDSPHNDGAFLSGITAVSYTHLTLPTKRIV